MTDLFTIHGVQSEPLHQHAIDRFSAALDQHQALVTGIMIRLEDLNGRKKSPDDKRCQAIVQLKSRANIVVDERGNDLYSVVALAADRVKQAVGRQAEKTIERRRQIATTDW
jgi:ribosome-associated translation inhibitor RaiA